MNTKKGKIKGRGKLEEKSHIHVSQKVLEISFFPGIVTYNNASGLYSDQRSLNLSMPINGFSQQYN